MTLRQSILLILLLLAEGTLLLPCASAQRRDLPEVVVSARRPLREIGVQKTAIDSAALKESIALSLADVLTFHSSVFVKSHGRATLSTVAFRGTSPSHTQVTWNGMNINSPMLGMTDFSTIPGCFIDRATLLHGTSSVNETGGGLGGLVKLATVPDAPPGLSLKYVQGIGSFSTFDEFLHITYGSPRWTASTRVSMAMSANNYKYVNHDKMVNVYDDQLNIIGRYHPVERNRSGAYRDLHVLQEVYHLTRGADRLGLNLWYVNSYRELPMLTTDYGLESNFENYQREQTLRSVFSWKRSRTAWSADMRAGYVHTHMGYDYKRDAGGGSGMVTMTRSRSTVNTFLLRADGMRLTPDKRWMFTGGLTAHLNHVTSRDKDVLTSDGSLATVGYDRWRPELSASLSAKWQPVPRLGLSAVVRQEMAGPSWAAPIPAFFIDGVLTRRGNLTARASISRNHKFPTLNDLYFLPGGNPDLKSEQGWSYDCGLTFTTGHPGTYTLTASASWFDSHIDDWILWLPTTKGFFSPRNVKKVHAYGIEAKGSLALKPLREWLLELDGSFSWTPSVNVGAPLSEADKSVGKQLPYVPRHSASVTGRLSWRSWQFIYKWVWYSRRFTMSSNEVTLTGSLPPYFMNNVSLSRSISFKPVDIDLKLAVNNLFDEDYLSVLARPMPGINFEFFIGIKPKW